jgi:hypothetical protein
LQKRKNVIIVASSFLSTLRWNVTYQRPSDDDHFGEWLFYFMQESGIRNVDLATSLDVAPSTISKWINQLTKPKSLRRINELVRLLKIQDQRDLEIFFAKAGHHIIASPSTAPPDPLLNQSRPSRVSHVISLDNPSPLHLQILPPRPEILVGRASALNDLLTQLQSLLELSGEKVQVLTAIRGWPGVGKTSLVSALAHDERVLELFPDGVLWTSLGQRPNILSKLISWGQALNYFDIVKARTIEDASAILRGLLQYQRKLLIVDDAWNPEVVEAFKVGGSECATLVTTREFDTAYAVVRNSDKIYKLDVLAHHDGLHLLEILAPKVVAHYPEESSELVKELEGLPLAIQVAGRLLAEESFLGFDIQKLIQSLKESTILIESTAPSDRADLEVQTIPSVSALLKKSTDALEPEVRMYYGFLGVFAPKPAIFDLEAIQAVWDLEDPRPTLRKLVSRGLLEPIGEGYQMHSLLALHARILLRELT